MVFSSRPWPRERDLTFAVCGADRRAAGALLVLALVLPAPLSGQPTAVGSELGLNEWTTGNQVRPAIARALDGTFVATWIDYGVGGVVVARRFDADGSPLGGDLTVDPSPVGSPSYPHAARGPDGGFVVVWSESARDGSGFGIFGRRLDSLGSPLAPVFGINEFTTGDQAFCRVASNAGGDFVVVWHSDGQDGDFRSVHGRRYAADGTALSGEFRINTTTVGLQDRPAVAMAADGRFVVSWTSNSSDGDGNGIVAQRLNAAGSLLGAEIAVNEQTSSAQVASRVGVDAQGRFVVVWEDAYTATVKARRFSSDGLPVAPELQVSGVGDAAFRPSVAVDPNGGAVIAWQTGASHPGFGTDVKASWFDAAGAPAGAEITLNVPASGSQGAADASSAADGDFAVVWNGASQDGSAFGIRARLFEVPCDPASACPLGGFSCADYDGDDYCDDVDCDDRRADVHPGREEIWYDGIDQDCDEASDFDQDGDLFDAEPPLGAGADCDDEDPTVHPGAAEICDGVPDNDCGGDGSAVGDPDHDFDGDGVTECGGDCDDQASSCTDVCGTDADVDSVPDCLDLCLDPDGDDHGVDQTAVVVGSGAVPVGSCTVDGSTPCVLPDAPCLGPDQCPGFPDGDDADADDVPDGCDVCLGDDASADQDGDGLCADLDCDDDDETVQDDDRCGVCGGDDSSCSIFIDGFESGDVDAW